MIHIWNQFDAGEDPATATEWRFNDLMSIHIDPHFGDMWSNDPIVLQNLLDAIELSNEQIGVATLQRWNGECVAAMLSQNSP